MAGTIPSSLVTAGYHFPKNRFSAGLAQPRHPDTGQRIPLTALFRQLREQTSAALDRPGSPREQLLRYVNSYFDFMVAHPNYPRLFERELMSEEPRLVALVQEHLRPLYGRLTGVLRAGMAKAEFRRVDPQQTLFSLVAMTVFYFA